MKWLIMNLGIMYVVSCADALGEDHSRIQKILRAIFWPLTIHSWFRTGSEKLHRLLLIVWTLLISGWILSLIADRLP